MNLTNMHSDNILKREIERAGERIMKRILAALIALMLLSCACCSLAEESLRVVNCESWVSLRSAPDTQAERLAQVPLGAYVTGEYDPYAQFSHCSYEGVSGYILNEYLAPAEEAQAEDLMPEGTVILDGAAAGLRVQAVRSSDGYKEKLWVGCTDADGALLWSYSAGPVNMTELDQTDAFLNSAAAEPFVAVYSSDCGLVALDLQTGAERWTLPNEVVNLGGSLSCAVGGDGTMYIGGYYGPDPVAIAPSGELLWESSSRYGEKDGYPLEFWWLYDLKVEDAGLAATYDSGSEHAGSVLFGLDGRMLAYKFTDE